MTKDELCEALNHVNASREKQNTLATKIEEQPHLIPILIAIIKEDAYPISCKACRVLEFITKKEVQPILQNIDAFILSLPSLTLESSIRPASKICQLLVQYQYSKKSLNSKKIHSDTHLNAITEAAFDWLIGEHKVAPKAYAMTILLVLGRKKCMDTSRITTNFKTEL
ncbi:adenylosuccinate lyase [Maribacter sp. ACAM166]|uniref:adenylosuccinate lyase n=1 Tax=Maribacter sp. ACAM166 TaxID=2508996 RepID=UPI0010FE2D60|nr:adenylosuccinate lyase [Maribacter sp. ACAM166]TLP79133.1 adenylosuccinate lyase [Maribacter sp. ACAM166]